MKFSYRLKMYLRDTEPLFYIIPLSLLLSALLIRVFSGDGIVMCASVYNKGLFPGPFMYAAGHTIRILLSGAVLSAQLKDNCLMKTGKMSLIFAAVVSLILLFEYKMIFVCVRLFSSLILSLAAAALSFSVFLCNKAGKKPIWLSLILSVLQSAFCIKLISLILSV